MAFTYRKIDSPSTGTIYIGLHHLPHEENRHYLQSYKMFLIL